MMDNYKFEKDRNEKRIVELANKLLEDQKL